MEKEKKLKLHSFIKIGQSKNPWMLQFPYFTRFPFYTIFRWWQCFVGMLDSIKRWDCSVKIYLKIPLHMTRFFVGLVYHLIAIQMWWHVKILEYILETWRRGLRPVTRISVVPRVRFLWRGRKMLITWKFVRIYNVRCA